MYQPNLFDSPELFAPKLAGPPQPFPELNKEHAAIDFETYDPVLRTHGPGWCFPRHTPEGRGHVVGVAVTTKTWSGYWGIGHCQNAHEPASVVKWLFAQLKKSNITWRVHHGLYDLGWANNLAEQFRIKLPARWWKNIKIQDTQILAPLINENKDSYRLDDLSKEYLGIGKDRLEFTDAARALRCKPDDVITRIRELPDYYTANYAAADGRRTYDLWDAMYPEVEKQNLHQILDLETRLVPALLDMRKLGVRVDLERAATLTEDLQKREEQMLYAIMKQYNRAVDVWSAASVAKLFDQCNLTYPRTPRTDAPSFTSDWLDAHPHPVAQQIAQIRKWNKARTTFLDGHVLSHAVMGRIHAVFSPLRGDKGGEKGAGDGGAVTGRFSSSSPNLQNLPSKDEEIAPMIRGLFLPEPGMQWAAIDYAAQEPRLAVHFAAMIGAPGVDRFVQAYHANPDMDFHAFGAELTGLPRKQAKCVTLGVMYTMGELKLCIDLRLPTVMVEQCRNGNTFMMECAGPEAKEVMRRYHEEMEFVSFLSRRAVHLAETRGWIRTLLGRIRHFIDKAGQGNGNAHQGRGRDRIKVKGAFPYKALNCLIQGSAADMMKKGIVDLYDHGHVANVTVHDELGISTENRETANGLKQIIVNAVQLLVPVTADIEMGPTWGAAE